jgi:hypothetical protein
MKNNIMRVKNCCRSLVPAADSRGLLVIRKWAKGLLWAQRASIFGEIRHAFDQLIHRLEEMTVHTLACFLQPLLVRFRRHLDKQCKQ